METGKQSFLASRKSPGSCRAIGLLRSMSITSSPITHVTYTSYLASGSSLGSNPSQEPTNARYGSVKDFESEPKFKAKVKPPAYGRSGTWCAGHLD